MNLASTQGSMQTRGSIASHGTPRAKPLITRAAFFLGRLEPFVTNVQIHFLLVISRNRRKPHLCRKTVISGGRSLEFLQFLRLRETHFSRSLRSIVKYELRFMYMGVADHFFRTERFSNSHVFTRKSDLC